MITAMLPRSSHSRLLKLTLMILFLASALVMSGERTEAASQTWTHGGYSQTCVPAYDLQVSYVAFGWDSGGGGGYVVNQYPTPGTPYTWVVDNPNNAGTYLLLPPGYTVSPDPYAVFTGNAYQACSTPVYAADSSYSAQTDQDVYNPGATIHVSLAAAAGGSGTSNNLGSFFCLGGCSGPPYVRVSAAFQTQPQIGACGGNGSASCSGTFTAPTTPGTYVITLGGCIWVAAPGECAASSMTFTVACPVGQTLSADGKSCVAPAPCTYSGSLAWGAGCSANVNTTTPSGQSVTIANTASGYTGSEQYTCAKGDWTGPTKQSCAV